MTKRGKKAMQRGIAASRKPSMWQAKTVAKAMAKQKPKKKILRHKKV